jgi:hypothetical protein
MAPDETDISSTITFTTTAMQELVAEFLNTKNENVIYCIPISRETAIEIAALS